jgi:hypothetical protein
MKLPSCGINLALIRLHQRLNCRQEIATVLTVRKFFTLGLLVVVCSGFDCGLDAVRILLINNSPSSIYYWMDGKEKPPLAPGQKMLIFTGNYRDYPIIIKTAEGQVLRYDDRNIPYPGGPFYGEKTNWVLQFQDNSLFILHNTNTVPVESIPEQPEGFPLRPLLISGAQTLPRN